MTPPRCDDPGRLWSLWDMLRFQAHDFCRATGVFGQFFCQINHHVRPTDDSFGACFGAVKLLIGECERLNLPVSLKQARSIETYVTSGGRSMEEIGRQVTDLYSRVVDELDGRHFVMVTKPGEYEEPRKWWADGIAKFPSITFDAEEASKCFALERPTAAVFHMMRILEAPLAVIARELGTNKHSPTWNAYLDAFKRDAAKKYPLPHGEDRRMRDYFAGLEAQLRAIKDAFRNPTMHSIERTYTTENAHELFVLMRGFLREAGKELAE